jgi:hypothetical protein
MVIEITVEDFSTLFAGIHLIVINIDIGGQGGWTSHYEHGTRLCLIKNTHILKQQREQRQLVSFRDQGSRTGKETRQGHH